MYTLDDAKRLDEMDSFPALVDEFRVPVHPAHGFERAAYLVGNSLGLQPKGVGEAIERQLNVWAEIGVEGHFEAEHWATFPERLEEGLAQLMGADRTEIVTMNTLTVNLHLLLSTFYAPTPERDRIVIEAGAFPSDVYAVTSHILQRGLDPNDVLIRVNPGQVACGEAPTLDQVLEAQGERIALVLLGGINYQTGELHRIEAITRECQSKGAIVGWDLAHVAGNVPVQLHAWNVDFAAWCSYKYLNGGPGAIASAFIHERYLSGHDLPRLAGWWGNRLETRFEMRDVIDLPVSAAGWALSTPPTLAIAPIEVALNIFRGVDTTELRAKSVRLTGFLEECLDGYLPQSAAVITPRDPERRGAQLSIRLGSPDAGRVVARMRHEHGVMVDSRGESIVRIAPAPLYNTYVDCWRAATALSAGISKASD